MEVYLDHAATTPLLPAVVETIYEAMKTTNGNPSSTHKLGRIAKTKIEQARKSIALQLVASAGEIFFTSCATEANNMVLTRCIKDLGVKRIISSPIEHHCILHTLDRVEEEDKVEVVLLDVNQQGAISLEQLNEVLASSDDKTLVCLMHVNNELGNILDLQKVGEICQAHSALFHTDAAQSMGKFNYDLSQNLIHFLTASGHKFHGPKGAGFLYMNANTILKPLLTGGAQERNVRSGTENLHGIIGLHAAFNLAYEEFDARNAKLTALKASMKEKLVELIPGILFNGTTDRQSCHILSASFPPSPKNEMLDFLLDMESIMISGGSACSSGSVKASHVLEAIGSSAEYKTIRFSFSHINTQEEIDFTCDTIAGIFAKV